MAASLPRGIAAPAQTASWATPDDDAVWVLVKDGRAWVHRTSGRYFFSQVASYLRIPAPSAITAEFLRAFRNAMRATAADVSQVSETMLTKETLRAMAWWISENQGRRDGSPSTRIWFPNGGIAAPGMGETMPRGVDGIRVSELVASGSQGHTGPVILDGGGGSSGGGSSGGGSSGGHSSTSSSNTSGVTEAAVTGGKVLLVGALLLGGVVAVARVAQGRNPLDRPALPPMPWSRNSKGGDSQPAAPARPPREKSSSLASSKVLAALKGGA